MDMAIYRRFSAGGQMLDEKVILKQQDLWAEATCGCSCVYVMIC